MIRSLTFALLLAGSGLAGLGLAQSQSPRKLISSLNGKDLFEAYCASCHGMDGKGHGPVASALKEPIPDLTTLIKRNKGKFPAADLEKMILGDAESRMAHGTREMPVWGPVFHRVEEDKDFAPVRVRRLVEFIRTKQAK